MTMHLPIMVNLLSALGLGVLIGIERQWRQRAAGLRTNALVAVGSAAFVALATVVEGENSPTRIAAQVASGIGFLGAGVIMREGAGVAG
jgi:putative Mg2+ transporter-C (MgtC) family protein